MFHSAIMPGQAHTVSASRATKLTLVAIITAAAALRCWAALVPAMVHPDEIFQYLEQAHRLVFGYGVVPWEYRYGMRSWMLPLLLSGPMRLGAAIDAGGDIYLVLPKLLMVAISLLVVPAAYALGARLSRMHGLVAAAVGAVWFELVYFGAHTLTETASVAMIMPAAAILSKDAVSRRALVAAGGVLSVAAILRFHYIPAIGVLVLLSCGRDLRGRWVPVVLGGIAGLSLGGAIDIAMGQRPFGWLAVNFYQNIVVNRSAEFGVSGPFTYLVGVNAAWGFALFPMLAFLVPVIPRYRALFWTAVLNLVVHSAIGHKEYRFVLLSTTILVVLSAIGSAECVRRLMQRSPARKARLLPVGIVLLWTAASGALAASPGVRPLWTTSAEGLQAAKSLRTVPGVCGVASSGLQFWETGGYVTLHRAVPLYLIGPPGDGRGAAGAPAFNVVIAPAGASERLPAAFRRRSCFSNGNRQVCTFVRTGGCNRAAGGEQRLDRVLLRNDR